MLRSKEGMTESEPKEKTFYQNESAMVNTKSQQTFEEKQDAKDKETSKNPMFQLMRDFVKSREFQEALLAYFEAFSSDMVNKPTFKPKIIDNQNSSKKYPLGDISVILPLGDQPINNELHPTVPHELTIYILYGSLYGSENGLTNKLTIYYKNQEFKDFAALLSQMKTDIRNKLQESQK